MGGGLVTPSLRVRGDSVSEVDRLEDGLGVIEDGRLGDLLDVVREEGLTTHSLRGSVVAVRKNFTIEKAGAKASICVARDTGWRTTRSSYRW